MQRLVLFDIDNTLLAIGQNNLPQQRAMNLAFEHIHGIPEAFDHIAFTGGLDLPLMVEVYQHWDLMTGEPGSLPNISGFKEVYFRLLAEALKDWTKGSICPGVTELLQNLWKDPRVQLGLESGNFRESAFIKLRRYGLDTYFQEGGFGGDHFERSEVVSSAIRSCGSSSGRTYGLNEVWLIGDTPSDIGAGQANGIRTLAVCTGIYSAQDLNASNPECVLSDLSNTAEVLNLLFQD